MRILIVEDLTNKLNEDLAWRKKELNFIYNKLNLSKYPDIELYYLRIGILLLYAHWEGYIKNSSYFYLNYIKNKRLNFNELSSNLITLSLTNKINICASSKKVSIRHELVNFIINELSLVANIPDKKLINTESNLKYEVLKEILFTLGLNKAFFELKENLIDSKLLKIRNKVAHGNHIPIDKNEFIETYNAVISMLDIFKDEIINASISSSYKNKQLLKTTASI